MTCNSNSLDLQKLDKEQLISNLSRTSLLDCLSNNVLLHLIVERMSTQGGLTSTSTSCNNMSPIAQVLNHQQNCLLHCRKPKLSLRIFLGTSTGHNLPFSTATDLFHSFCKLNGSICLAEMPLILTMSSPISTQYPTIPMMTLSLGKASNFTTDCPCQPKPSKPMETRLLPGTALLMPPCLSLNTGRKSSRPTANLLHLPTTSVL
jgi:hypothetical protein